MTLRKEAEATADKVYDELVEIWGASDDGIASNKRDIADAIERVAKEFAERALRKSLDNGMRPMDLDDCARLDRAIDHAIDAAIAAAERGDK